MQSQIKELRQLHSSDITIDNNHSKILEKVDKTFYLIYFFINI